MNSIEQFITELKLRSVLKDKKDYFSLFKEPTNIEKFKPFISEELMLSSLSGQVPSIVWKVYDIIKEETKAAVFIECVALISNSVMIINEILKIELINNEWKLDSASFQLEERLSLDAYNVN